MGSKFSAPSSSSPPNSPQQQNPKTTPTAAMSSPESDNSTTPEPQPPKTLENQNPNQEQESQNQESETPKQDQETQNQEEEEEEGECGFCLFMKGGQCKETFVNWEKCIEEGEKNNEDIVEKCYEATSALKKCMEANQDYYGVILQAEKDVEQQAINQLEQEKLKEKKGVIVVDDTNQEKEKEKEVVAEQES